MAALLFLHGADDAVRLVRHERRGGSDGRSDDPRRRRDPRALGAARGRPPRRRATAALAARSVRRRDPRARLAALVDPALVPGVPEARSWEAWTLLAVGMLFYGILALRALRTYRLTHRAGDLAVAIGIVWLAAAMIPALTQDYWNIGWWLAHGLELAGIALVALPGRARPATRLGAVAPARRRHQRRAARARTRRRSSARTCARCSCRSRRRTRRPRSTRAASRCARSRSGRSSVSRPRSSASSPSAGSCTTSGSSRPPREILRKPGALSDDELAEIRRHPAAGDALLRDLGGFSPAVLRLVRHHHERLDGSGLPRPARRRRAAARHADPRGLRRVRRARLGPRLPRGVDARARGRAAPRRGAVRPALRRRARDGGGSGA